MYKRNELPRLEDKVHIRIWNMVRDVGNKWTERLHSAALRGRWYWLQEIKRVEEECIQVRCTLSSLPVPFVLDLIIIKAFEYFTKIIGRYNDDNGRPRITRSYDRSAHQGVCESMLKAVLLPCLYKCNVDEIDSVFVQELVIKLLYLIPNVCILNIPAVFNKISLPLLLERIPMLTVLQEFRFNVGCTKEIIAALSMFCTNLKLLSVEDSSLVDDCCIMHLIKLKQLLILNIGHTDISDEGYVMLLTGLPKLQNIVWFGNLDIVLRNVFGQLPSVKKVVGHISDAKLLAEKCPNMTNVVLFSITRDISHLTVLSSLSTISVVQSSCTAIGFNVAIRSIGSILTTLNMFQVVNINVDSLVSYCTALKAITIAYSHIMGPEHNSFSRELPHFKNVEEIRLKQNWGSYDFCLLLHLYVNLKLCYIMGMHQVSDLFIERVVTHGGFRRVTEFVTEHCEDMSMASARLLMKACEGLTKLGNFKYWSKVTDEEFRELLNFVRINNLALRVCLT